MKDHLLISYTDGNGVFSHYDENGLFLEELTVPSFGISPSFIEIVSFAQWHDTIYLMAVNRNDSPEQTRIMEFDRNLTYVRTVFNGVDANDPTQNPLGFPQFFFDSYQIALDRSGNIYLIDASSLFIWKYDNNGIFLHLNTVPDYVVTPFAHLSVKPDDDCTVVIGIQDNNATTLDGPWNYNDCTQTLTIPVRTGALSRPLGEFNANCNDVRFYLGNLFPVPNPPRLLRVYDTNWNLLLTIPDLVVPNPTFQVHTLIPIDGDQYIWLISETSSTGDLLLYKVELATNTIVSGPIVLASILEKNLTIAFIFKVAPSDSCRNTIYSIPGGWISSTLIGAN